MSTHTHLAALAETAPRFSKTEKKARTLCGLVGDKHEIVTAIRKCTCEGCRHLAADTHIPAVAGYNDKAAERLTLCGQAVPARAIARSVKRAIKCRRCIAAVHARPQLYTVAMFRAMHGTGLAGQGSTERAPGGAG